MRWHNQLLIVMAVFGAVAATAGAAWGAAAGQQIKGKVDNGTLTITGTSEPRPCRSCSPPATRRRSTSWTAPARSSSRSTGAPSTRSWSTQAAGDDLVRIDQADGAFTDTEATTLNGQSGDDTLLGGSFAETLVGGPGNDFADGNQGSDVALHGLRQRHLPVGPRRRQRHRRGPGGQGHDALQRRQHRREDRPLRQRPTPAAVPRHRQHHHGHRRRRNREHQRPRRP